jgi:hypothetical protein
VTNNEFPTFLADIGPQTIDFEWKTTANTGTLTAAQRVFSATSPLSGASSGPVKFAQVVEGAAVGPSSLPFGSHQLTVTIGVSGNLQNASKFNDPTTVLRVADKSGSRNNAIDCDVGRSFRLEIATGCRTPYQINKGEICPNSTTPLNCAPIETGDKVGPLRQGMDDRFTPCPINHWTNPGDPTKMPVILPGDRRAIPVLIVPLGAFGGSGSGHVPIVDFATFYITGWDYVGAKPPCADNEPFPLGASADHKGDIWGHFIKYVDSINSGGGGSDICDFGSFGSCVPVLTE